jgi:L-cysteate sulfo-lyase
MDVLWHDRQEIADAALEPKNPKADTGEDLTMTRTITKWDTRRRMKDAGAVAIRKVLEPYSSAELSLKPTPIRLMNRISTRLGAERRAWVMRDDLTGFALGGNKVRKLDYLVGAALSKGANTLVVPYASSFSRNAAAAGSACGLEVHVLVAGEEVSHNALSRAFYAAMDAKLHYVGDGAQLGPAQRALVGALRAEGRRVIELHPGGSDEVGTLGYVEAFAEIADFMARECVVFDRIFHASGSAATQAGLVLGRAISGVERVRVVGVAISQPAEIQRERVTNLARTTADMLGIVLDPSTVIVDDRYLGEGYPIPSVASRVALDVFAKEEGLLLDPIYAGKAAAALLGHARNGELDDATNVLMIHTGGNAGAYY